jgi:hypothetical protein
VVRRPRRELNDGRVLENVKVTHHGAVIAPIGHDREISLDPHAITNVLTGGDD